jgi:hypothetical protein
MADMTVFGIGYEKNSDASNSGCGTTAYCPGDGSTYALYSGVNISVATITAKPAGEGCTHVNGTNAGTQYSNGGTA